MRVFGYPSSAVPLGLKNLNEVRSVVLDLSQFVEQVDKVSGAVESLSKSGGGVARRGPGFGHDCQHSGGRGPVNRFILFQ